MADAGTLRRMRLPKRPDFTDPEDIERYEDAMQVALQDYARDVFLWLSENVPNSPILQIPNGVTSIQFGSGVITPAGGDPDFVRATNLPVTFATTSASGAFAYQRTGSGIIPVLAVGTFAVGGIPGTTATDATVSINVDGVDVFAGACGMTAAGQMVLIIGRLFAEIGSTFTYRAYDCPIGIPYKQSISIAIATNTAGQNVLLRMRDIIRS